MGSLAPTGIHRAELRLTESVLRHVRVLCDKTFPGEMQHTDSLTQIGTHVTIRRMGTTGVRLGEPVSFIGILTGIWVRGYLRDHGWEITRRIRNDSKTAATPRSTVGWVTAHKAGKLEHTE